MLLKIKPKKKLETAVKELPVWERPAPPVIEWTENNLIGRETLEYCKKGEVSATDIRDIAREQQENCYDVRMKMNDLDFSVQDSKIFTLQNEEIGYSLLTPYALQQLGNRYGIPAQYVKKCMGASTRLKNGGDYRELVMDNYRTWMSDDNSTVLLRQYDNHDASVTRAVLSDKYVPFDTPDIMDVVCSNVPIRKHWSVRQYLVNPERFHLRLVSDEPLDIPKEDLFMGFTIDSSDVGRSSLNMRFIIFKQVCTNGLILPKFQDVIMRQIHVGAGAERFEDNLVACLSTITQAKEYAVSLLTDVAGKKLPFKLDDEEKIDSFRSSRGISKEAMNEVLEMVKANRYGEPSRWALINAMTEVAQNFGIDTRLNMERQAGLLLAA